MNTDHSYNSCLPILPAYKSLFIFMFISSDPLSLTKAISVTMGLELSVEVRGLKSRYINEDNSTPFPESINIY